jgi:hypothetical protein
MIRGTNYTHKQTRNFDKNFEGKIRDVTLRKQTWYLGNILWKKERNYPGSWLGITEEFTTLTNFVAFDCSGGVGLPSRRNERFEGNRIQNRKGSWLQEPELSNTLFKNPYSSTSMSRTRLWSNIIFCVLLIIMYFHIFESYRDILRWRNYK